MISLATKEAEAKKGVRFELIEVSHLREAPYNPRRTFDDESLKELVESVKAKEETGKLGVRIHDLTGERDKLAKDVQRLTPKHALQVKEAL